MFLVTWISRSQSAFTEVTDTCSYHQIVRVQLSRRGPTLYVGYVECNPLRLTPQKWCSVFCLFCSFSFPVQFLCTSLSLLSLCLLIYLFLYIRLRVYCPSHLERTLNNSFLLLPAFLQVILCCLPQRSGDFSSRVMITPCWQGVDVSHFMFSILAPKQWGRSRHLRRQLLSSHLCILQFTTVLEDHCSWNDNKNIFQQICFYLDIYVKYAYVYLRQRSISRISSFTDVLKNCKSFNMTGQS